MSFLLRELGEDDLQSIQTLFEACEDYFIITTGGPVTSASAHSLYIQLPEGKSYEDKYILGIYEGSKLIGIIDAIIDYPNQGAVTLGLFLVDPKYHDCMKKAYNLLESWCIDQGVSKIRLSAYEILEDEVKFWQEMGFQSICEKLQDGNNITFVMEKFLLEKLNNPVS